MRPEGSLTDYSYSLYQPNAIAVVPVGFVLSLYQDVYSQYYMTRYDITEELAGVNHMFHRTGLAYYHAL